MSSTWGYVNITKELGSTVLLNTEGTGLYFNVKSETIITLPLMKSNVRLTQWPNFQPHIATRLQASSFDISGKNITNG